MRKDHIVVLSIKPKYAELIYSGKKAFEYRKQPPPVGQWVYLYESSPVGAITGRVIFAAHIKGFTDTVWNLAQSSFPLQNLGLTFEELLDYCGKNKTVTACLVSRVETFKKPLKPHAPFRPPQNWGSFYIGE